MNKFKRFMKNSKAISPIFATLILIAIAVIAGIVVYMFTSGTIATMTGGGTTGQEKVAVQSASWDGTKVTLLAQSTGGATPNAQSVIVKDGAGNTVATGTVDAITAGAWSNGALVTITCTPVELVSGGFPATGTYTYTATLVTAAGGSFVSPAFTATGS
jgi:flagellin-like protein